MINLWGAIALTSVFTLLVLQYFIARDSREIVAGSSRGLSAKSLWMPLLAVSAAVILYFYSDSYQKQQHWNQVAKQMDQVKSSGSSVPDAMKIQDLLLGIRSEAYYHPQEAQLWFGLGQAYANLQMRDIALQSLERAVRLEQRPGWLVATAQILAGSDSEADQERALFYLQRALTQEPGHQSALITQGFVLAQMGRYPQAIQSWQTLAAQPGLSPRMQEFLAQQIEKASQASQ